MEGRLQKGEEVRAFADDILMKLLGIGRLSVILPVVLSFGDVSGCYINVLKCGSPDGAVCRRNNFGGALLLGSSGLRWRRSR